MRRGRSAALLIACVLAAACGIQVMGTAPSIDSDAGPIADGAPPIDAPLDAIEDVADASVEADADADAKPTCPSVTFSDALTALDAGWVVSHDSSNGDHPKIDPSSEGNAVSLVTPGAGSSVGGIYRSPAALKAFDMSFRYILECPNGPANCGAGMTALWLEATDAGAGELYPPVSGSTLGVPPALRGGAFAIDIQQDAPPVDPAVPSLSLLAIDGTKSPGQYDWHTTNGPPDAGLIGAHDVALVVRKGMLVAKVDGVTALSGPVATDFTAWLGIAAATSGQTALFFIRNFSATLYSCDDP
jgi:hypothetical protein